MAKFTRNFEKFMTIQRVPIPEERPAGKFILAAPSVVSPCVPVVCLALRSALWLPLLCMDSPPKKV